MGVGSEQAVSRCCGGVWVVALGGGRCVEMVDADASAAELGDD